MFSLIFYEQNFPTKLSTESEVDDDDEDDEQSAQTTADTYSDYMPLKRLSLIIKRS